MSSNFAIGIELLVVGMLVVFSVLVLLMCIMKTMSSIVNKAQNGAEKVNARVKASEGAQVGSPACTSEEELAAVVAVLSNVLPKKGTPVRLNIIEVKN